PAAAGRRAVLAGASAWASLILALVGAFTLVGTLAAILCGLIAVVTILRNRERLAGLGYAVAGILLGFVFTALTAFALFGPELFAAGAWMRERNMAAVVDHSGPLEVGAKGWTITRPNEQWGVARGGQVNDPIADIFLTKAPPELVLVQVRRHGFVDVRQDSTDKNMSTKEYESQLLGEYREDPDGRFGGAVNPNPKDKDEGNMRLTNGEVRKGPYSVTAPPGYDGRGMELDVLAGHQRWVLILRFYRGQSNTKDAG